MIVTILSIVVTLGKSFIFFFIVVQLRSSLIEKLEGQGVLDLSISLMRVLLMLPFLRWTERFVSEFTVLKLSKWCLIVYIVVLSGTEWTQHPSECCQR